MDPFRDDREALRIRVGELEEKLVEKREELVRVAEPHAALAKALKESDRRSRERAEEIEALEAKLAGLRATIEREREELARTKGQVRPEKEKKKR